MQNLKFIILAVAVIFITACNESIQPESAEPAVRAFIFEITDSQGVTESKIITTNEKTVGAALLEAALIEGEESAYGLMVSHVNGIRADYELDGMYWAFYVDGEYALYGVDKTDIEEGKTYALVCTKA